MHELELYHHGILGQKWGVRRFQNPDGTRTAAGKKRYQKDVYNDVQTLASSNGSRVSSIRKKSEDIYRLTDEMAMAYEKALSKVSVDGDGQKRISNILRKDFGDGVDDDELFPMLLDDYVNDYIDESMPKSLTNKRSELDKAYKDYFDDIKDFSDTILKDFSDTPLLDAKNMTEKSAAAHRLDEVLDASWNKYAYRHFDDWMLETEQYNDAYSRVASAFIKEYNKNYGS